MKINNEKTYYAMEYRCRRVVRKHNGRCVSTRKGGVVSGYIEQGVGDRLIASLSGMCCSESPEFEAHSDHLVLSVPFTSY